MTGFAPYYAIPADVLDCTCGAEAFETGLCRRASTDNASMQGCRNETALCENLKR